MITINMLRRFLEYAPGTDFYFGDGLLNTIIYQHSPCVSGHVFGA